jgi:hypothetical protein
MALRSLDNTVNGEGLYIPLPISQSVSQSLIDSIYYLMAQSIVKVKVKIISLQQAVEARGIVRRRGSHIFYTIDSQMAVRFPALCAGCPLPRWRFMVFISVKGWVDTRAIVWLNGLSQLKNPITSLGIEPTTFRIVAKRLNQLHYRVPPQSINRTLSKSGLLHNHLIAHSIDWSTHHSFNKWLIHSISSHEYAAAYL